MHEPSPVIWPGCFLRLNCELYQRAGLASHLREGVNHYEEGVNHYAQVAGLASHLEGQTRRNR